MIAHVRQASSQWFLGHNLTVDQQETRRIVIQRLALATLLIAGATFAAGATLLFYRKQ